MRCRYCGYEIPDGILYCEKCGGEVRIVPDYNPLDDMLAAHVKEALNNTGRNGRQNEGRRRVLHSAAALIPAGLQLWVRTGELPPCAQETEGQLPCVQTEELPPCAGQEEGLLPCAQETEGQPPCVQQTEEQLPCVEQGEGQPP